MQRKKTRYVRWFERTGETRRQSVLPASVDKAIERGDIHMIEKTARSFFGGIEHGAGKTVIGHERQHIQIGRAIGKKNADELGVACLRPQCPHAIGSGLVGREANLDIIDSGRGHRGDGVNDRPRRPKCSTGGGADRPTFADRANDVGRDSGIKRAERALCRVFQIDDVGASGPDRFRLGRVGHAREHQGHCRVP